jgi:hypothetical protein
MIGKEDFQSEKISKYTKYLSNIINRNGGKILDINSNSITALFLEGDPLFCAMTILYDQNVELQKLSIDRLPSIVISQIDDRSILELINSSDHTRTERIGQSAWEGEILTTPQTLARFKIPQGLTMIDYGVHTFEHLDEPIHLIGLMVPKDKNSLEYKN